MPISTSEQVTYITLYFFALRNYGRFLNRFYFYHFPYIKIYRIRFSTHTFIFIYPYYLPLFPLLCKTHAYSLSHLCTMVSTTYLVNTRYTYKE